MRRVPRAQRAGFVGEGISVASPTGDCQRVAWAARCEALSMAIWNCPLTASGCPMTATTERRGPKARFSTAMVTDPAFGGGRTAHTRVAIHSQAS